jgi:hypothetical protein
MQQKAPTNVSALTGAKIPTAEAAETFQSHYQAFAVGSQGDFTDGIPQLPCELQKVRNESEWKPALPLPDML